MQIIKTAAKVLLPVIRVKDETEPRLKNIFIDRFVFLSIKNAKMISIVSSEIIKSRDLSEDFAIDKDKKLSILIPFRNRENHLNKILPILRKKLTDQNINYHIFIVEQSDDKTFNKASLINIGFAQSKDDFDYFCIHDVDMLPVDATYACPSLPLRATHVIRTSDGNREIATSNFGGVILFRKEHFLAINGMSNEFWHWGREDDNLLFRFLSKRINPVIDTKGVFDEIDDSTDRFKVVINSQVKTDKKTAKAMIARNKRYQNKVARGLIPPCDEGLSDLRYELIERIEEAEDLTRLRVRL